MAINSKLLKALQSNKTHQLWAASFPSLIQKEAGSVLAFLPTEVPPAPGSRPPPVFPHPASTRQCPHLKALELPTLVILRAFFVLCLLFQPLQSLDQ